MDKHIAVFGATSGIGRSVLDHFSVNNRISAFGRRTDLLRELSSRYNEVSGYTCDVGNKDTVSSQTKLAVQKYDKIDILIYTAGVQFLKPHKLMTQAEFNSSYASNLGGMLNVSSVFCSAKISQKNATFCAITSIASIKAESGLLTYSAEKSGMETLLKGLAKEAAPRRFVGVAPGFLKTEMTQSKSFYNETVVKEIEKLSPLGLIDMQDVVNAVAFLTSASAERITGHTLAVDAGFAL